MQDGTYAYVYGHELISQTDNAGNQTYFLGDDLGSTKVLTDGNGNVTAQAFYDVFGNVRSHSGTATSEYLFAGQEYDSTLGYLYLRARYYDPTTGRFISKDPLVKGASGSQGYNRYAYVTNDPTDAVDPRGLCEEDNPECPGAGLGGLEEDWIQAQLPGLDTGDGSAPCPNSGQSSTASAQTMAQVRATGDVGEQAAGISKNTEQIGAPSRRAAYRIPDILDRYDGVIGEVKNVSYQYYSSQLRDYVAFARQNGFDFVLVVRQSTQLSPQLQAAVDQGLIILRRILP